VFSIGYDFHVGNGATGANNGNVWGITNYKDNSRNQSFTYDSLNRLTSAQNAGTDCTKKTLNLNQTEYWGNNYGYDPWGNLTSKTVTKCSAEHLNAPALVNNQLSGYGYDAAGNMTSDPTDGGIALSYDQENRIQSTAGYTYTYDADGNRVKKINGSTGTLYWYMAPGIVAESDLSGTLKSEYVFFDGERVARRDLVAPGGVFYYFSDHLKTASVITDSLGNIKSESDYYPWGGELQFVANDSNHYKFTGKERDETGLDYFGARYYSNGLARFITPDWAEKAVDVPYAEFGDPQSLNLYTYVRNIPTVNIDSDGHCPDLCIAEAVILTAAITSVIATPAGQQAVKAGIKLFDKAADALAAGGSALASGCAGSGACLTGMKPPGGPPAYYQAQNPEGDAQQAKQPPNPNGSKGAPDHQETADEEAAKMGGDREVRVQTPGGEKGSRVIDAAKVDENGKVTQATQVIRPNKNGTPPAREVRAAADIQKATGVKPKLVPVRPIKKPEGQ
jgi:RHS repeat-associated protein